MSLTYQDLIDRLKQQDETSILEILEITSDELIDRFGDKIEDKEDWLYSELEEEEEDE